MVSLVSEQQEEKGTFEQISFALLLIRGLDRRWTGTLTVNQGAGERSLLEFQRGLLCRVLVPDPYARLGKLLVDAKVVTEDQTVMIGTGDGMSIRFEVSDVRPMGRDSMGVKGIELRDEDLVVGMSIVRDPENEQILAVSEHGYGKRTPVDEWRIQNRGGKGLLVDDSLGLGIDIAENRLDVIVTPARKRGAGSFE